MAREKPALVKITSRKEEQKTVRLRTDGKDIFTLLMVHARKENNNNDRLTAFDPGQPG